MRYAPRLIPAGSAPAGALVEPLIAAPPKSPLGEHTLIPEVAWMIEQDGVFVHVPESERAQLEVMRGYAELTKLDGTAKGGVLAAIALWGSQRAAGAVPVYFVGVGEKVEDLETFNAQEFAQALLA